MLGNRTITSSGNKNLPTGFGGYFAMTCDARDIICVFDQTNRQTRSIWFDRLNLPDKLRVASQIRLTPNQDDTKIDCLSTVEQWFVPETP